MSIYKLTFVRNEVFTCKEVSDIYSLSGPYHYEHIVGKLIYAIVKADSEPEALAFVEIIQKEIQETIFGIDFVE